MFLQDEFEERRNLLKNRMLHSYMELRNLMGERLRLLETYTPVDTASFHRRVAELLVERVALLERVKLGARAAG